MLQLLIQTVIKSFEIKLLWVSVHMEEPAVGMHSPKGCPCTMIWYKVLRKGIEWFIHLKNKRNSNYKYMSLKSRPHLIFLQERIYNVYSLYIYDVLSINVCYILCIMWYIICHILTHKNNLLSTSVVFIHMLLPLGRNCVVAYDFL